jgi:hypothetical protein
MNKRKIINDPVYGFINIDDDFIYDLIEHPYFQRLRRIKQLGMTHLVYPGAVHTRLQHSLGSVYLMQSAIDIIRSKGHEISVEEARAVKIAILLHDLGHGPFSHTLERKLIKDYSHEEFSMLMLEQLNNIYEGKLDMAIRIFKNQYSKKFLHQLVSSQLDMDRLDYLRRDSFFTGVSEGVIGSDRIIKMLNVKNDQLVVEAKGIHSIEKFLIARWIMYWQVYFHKTVVAAEQLISNIIIRAKELIKAGHDLPGSEAFMYFLYEKYKEDQPDSILENFTKLDDTDITFTIKLWTDNQDKVLSELCKNIVKRELYKIEFRDHPFKHKEVKAKEEQFLKDKHIKREELKYFIFSNSISNKAYSAMDDKIQIYFKNGEIADIAEASDMLNLSVLSKNVKKYFLCYPKENPI